MVPRVVNSYAVSERIPRDAAGNCHVIYDSGH